jgi:hypothetical protein
MAPQHPMRTPGLKLCGRARDLYLFIISSVLKDLTVEIALREKIKEIWSSEAVREVMKTVDRFAIRLATWVRPIADQLHNKDQLHNNARLSIVPSPT